MYFRHRLLIFKLVETSFYKDRTMLNTDKPHHVATDPIKGLPAIAKVIDHIKGSARDTALFTLGTNLAFRASDLLSLNLGDVRGLRVGDVLRLKERKTGNQRSVTVNAKVVHTISELLLTRVGEADDAPLFVGLGGVRTFV
jgi:site-specific recombinase XerC